MSLKDASQCQAPGHALSGHVRASIDAAARPRWTCLGAWHLTMARAGSRRGRFGHGRYQVPDVSLKVEEERARALAEELDDRVEAAVEDVLLDHERRREDQDIAVSAAAADEDAVLPQRTPRLPGELGVRELEPEEEAAATDVADGGMPTKLVL